MEKYRITYPDMAEGHLSEGYQCYPKLLEIEQETQTILRGLSQERAVAIALAVSQEIPSGSGDTRTPAVVVFSREGDHPDNIWEKLLKVMKTPDYDTPSFNPDDRPYIDELIKVLFQTGYCESFVGAIASGHMVRVAGGDPAAIEWRYRDMARRYPQYSSSWYETLEQQFEGGLTLTGSPVEQELFHLLDENTALAQRHEQTHNRLQEGEDTVTYISRQLEEAAEIFDLSTVEGFASAAHVMDKVFIDYRKETYALRGIQYEY